MRNYITPLMKSIKHVLNLYSKSPDVYIVSFPKSGRTWLRMLIGKTLLLKYSLELNNPLNLVQISRRVPYPFKIFVTHEDDPEWKKPSELESSKKKYRNKKVIFLVRDPRDVLVSSFFEKTKRLSFSQGRWLSHHDRFIQERITNYKIDSMSSYIRNPVGSLDTILKYYNIWYLNKDVPREFLLVRYEDLRKDSLKEMKKIMNLLSVDVSDDILKQAITFCSFDNMKRMEKDNKFDIHLRPGNASDSESFKVRKGKVGGFVDYLSPDDICYANKKIKNDLLPAFDYS